ncbi:hypothetical protein HY412_00125 [Candidatus Kaiserbacteria bacterium]|nr:hypothetical protein [Candidatus Kaiserbacteria bacterium]
MTFEGKGGESVPQRHRIPHYHGDQVRVIFVISALVIIVAQSTGADLPLSTVGAVASATMLVIAAGITNSALHWIHWINAFLAILGTLLFGSTVVGNYRAGSGFFDPSFIFLETLALLSLIALYLTTRTIRGKLIQSNSR